MLVGLIGWVLHWPEVKEFSRIWVYLHISDSYVSSPASVLFSLRAALRSLRFQYSATGIA